jgi:hypothetical protein
MTDFHEDINSLKNPKNIKEALFASGPSLLMRAFEKDQTVMRLVRGGAKVAPLIAKELEKNGMKLDTITLSCFAYILQKVDPAIAAKVLKDLFIKAMKCPDPFFIYFAVHALRQNLKLPFKPHDPEYTYGELQETLAWVERTQPK